jgi:pimeloyl-ACP methyl ester carboxylesterase
LIKRTRKIVAVAGGAAVLIGLLPAAPASAADEYGYGGGIQWTPCEGSPEVDCASVTVPVDWSRPYGETIKIAVARRKATDASARLGSLMINPGGPGGDGAGLVKFVPKLFSDEVHRRYDIVGFDPRGVGESNPVMCSTTTAAPADVTTEAEFTSLRKWNRDHAANCREHTGKVYDFLDTVSVAHDMDAIRSGLGERKLNFLGISYGTLMGQQYAELYPRRVGRFVVDSNMDHSLDTFGFVRTEATAAEEMFDQFVAWCDRTAGCALHGSDVRALHHNLMARIERGEIVYDLPDGGKYVLTVMDYLGSIHGAGYGPNWYFLAESMVELRDWPSGGSPAAAAQKLRAVLTLSATAHTGRLAPRSGAAAALAKAAATTEPEETYPDPFQAILCQDWGLPIRGFQDVQRLKRVQERAAPDMTLSVIGWGAALACVGLENRVRNPQHRLRIRGADPFLFVNSRYDPATAYEWGVAAAQQARQTLLTYDGWGHFAYDKSPCVVETTDRYLTTGRLPRPNTHCAAVEPAPPTAPETRTPDGVPLPTGPRPGVPGFQN